MEQQDNRGGMARTFWQMTWDEYITGDIGLEPLVEKAAGGRRHYFCPICGALVGGYAAGVEYECLKDGRCRNGHKIETRRNHEDHKRNATPP